MQFPVFFCILITHMHLLPSSLTLLHLLTVRPFLLLLFPQPRYALFQVFLCRKLHSTRALVAFPLLILSHHPALSWFLVCSVPWRLAHTLFYQLTSCRSYSYPEAWVVHKDTSSAYMLQYELF